MTTPDQSVITWVLTTVASISGMLNMLFLKSVLGDVRELRESRNDHGQTLARHEADISWLKRESSRGDDGELGPRFRPSHP